MPKDIENVKEKIRKLLALSRSDNGNEAAAALLKASELAEKHGLEETARIFWREIYGLLRAKKSVDKRRRNGL